jgi:hypothetical protein
MLDAKQEIDRLRSSLKFKGFTDTIIDEICREASIEIGAATSDILSDAMAEAYSLGKDIGSADLIEEIRAVRSGSSFEIIADSGSDYSEPPFPMIPKILKGAKGANSSPLPKQMPEKVKADKSRSSKAISVTLDAAYKNINDVRKQAKLKRDEMKKNKTLKTNLDPMAIPTTMASMYSINSNRKASASRIKNEIYIEKAVDSPNTNPNPKKSTDIQSPLNNINTRINESIDQAIDSIIRRYEDMF